MYFLLGLIGHPLHHSLSPYLHKAALAHYGLPGDYHLIDLLPENLEHSLLNLPRLGYVGCNVTYPFKRAVFQLVSDLTTEARKLKAVNTIKVSCDGVLIGHNTDLAGFMLALSEAWSISKPKGHAVVLGAGGAARAAVWGLLHLGWTSIIVASRRLSEAQAVVAEVATTIASVNLPTTPQIHAQICTEKFLGEPLHLLINCTPIGLYDDYVPQWLRQHLTQLDKHGLCFDLVYRQGGTTPLVRMASQMNYSAIDGISMLVHQAALAFNYWTGKPAPIEIMRSCLMAESHSDISLRKQ